MNAEPYYRDDKYVLSQCTKYLAHLPASEGGVLRQATEGWRFPIVESSSEGSDWNDVTFIYLKDCPEDGEGVGVIGTFYNLYVPITLRDVLFHGSPTRYLSVTVPVRKRELHTYRYLSGRGWQTDAINPQTKRMDNGVLWSAFFTEEYASPSVLTDRELRLLTRLVAEITPLRTPDAENYLRRFYNDLDQQARVRQQPHIYRLDDMVGEVNFIDNLLARAEHHHLGTYRTGLARILRALAISYPNRDPATLQESVFEQLLSQLEDNRFPGWGPNEDPSPRKFIEVLRRHTVMGAFTHPRHGGNSAAAGWNYLRQRYSGKEPSGTCFDWPFAMEKPLGASDDYTG